MRERRAFGCEMNESIFIEKSRVLLWLRDKMELFLGGDFYLESWDDIRGVILCTTMGKHSGILLNN